MKFVVTQEIKDEVHARWRAAAAQEVIDRAESIQLRNCLDSVVKDIIKDDYELVWDKEEKAMAMKTFSEAIEKAKKELEYWIKWNLIK